MIKKSLITLTAGAMLATPVALLSPTAAHADVERFGACGPGNYDFSVDREGRGYEVNIDLDALPRGSKWRVTLRQDGNRVLRTVRTADFEGEIDLERFRPNTSGNDTFKFRAKRLGVKSSCGSSITVG